MFSKLELMVGGISMLFIALALYLVQLQSTTASLQNAVGESAQQQPAAVSVVNEQVLETSEITLQAENNKTMKIDDVIIGTGPKVESGNTVAVHYVGTLQDGTEFDSSKKRGVPFEFKVGAGMVIAGWEEGVQGMQVGGERVLVIPPEKAYGDQGIGPIPGGATLVFTIELLEIK